MIILLGPDGSGKSTFARKLADYGDMQLYHFTQHSGYKDYIEPLSSLAYQSAVLDRHAICELPYATVMSREFKFTLKQWHNILLMTLIQRPVIYLFSHKPLQEDYPEDQYLPYGKWADCFFAYKHFLDSNLIPYRTFDYMTDIDEVSVAIKLQYEFNRSMAWWLNHWNAGYGCAGSANPKFLLVAERIGPSNMHNIPFEAGPTGTMMSQLLHNTKTPIGAITLTNMVKAKRGDSRKVNDQDIELLREEIEHLKPKKIIFMGAVAKAAVPIAKELGIEIATIPHLGFFNHKGIKDMSGYYTEWRKELGLVPSVAYT